MSADTVILGGRAFPRGVNVPVKAEMLQEALDQGLKAEPISWAPGFFHVYTGPKPPITKEDKQWLVQDASADEKSSLTIGQGCAPGLPQEECLTRLLLNSEQQKAEMAALKKMVEQLTVTTQALLDALAEDQDPDQPITYMDGTPI